MTNRFLVLGTASPDLPLRVLNLFAQQDLAYDAAGVFRHGDQYRVTVDCPDLPAARALVILEKMRAMVMVEAAELSN